MRNFGQIALGLLLCVGTVLTMAAPNANMFENHELTRIIFWHLPCALVCTLFLCAPPYFAFRYLRTRERHWDLRACAAMEIGTLTGLLTLITGMLFSDVQWGGFWDWDPRQTSFLLVMLLLGVYFAIRASFSDSEKRAANSSAYVMASLLPVLFLIFVFPRVLKSLHPKTTLIDREGMDPTYRAIFLTMFALILLVCLWLYKLRVRAGMLEDSIDHANAELGNRHDSAPTGVVRPVSLPTEHR